MPSIAPSYLYTFLAITAISALLLQSFNSYAAALRTVPETKQLKNLMALIAAKGIDIITAAETTNSTIQVFVQMPRAVGNREYWMGFRNDSALTWIEGGLGKILEASTFELRILLPRHISASGYYVGGFGPAVLECYMNETVPQLKLGHSGG